ncbi:FAD binding domain-containing protein [Desulforhopalus singaporensis]|uniref:Carbon-monoxide dehydrogenase medium subunit n=1 Tax=Desulforhopalus singaporensis TaxID=91360 RepID=A0A1H0SJK0_9BACT|nr:FAD binding domain-containing protein [Desulforhopalus singaporensis]SDP41992.1 carbon-monoxide dehydrogenase medium subunit [Desulforhopalus singaporensis]
MHNSRIITNEFDFCQPATLTELFGLLNEPGGDDRLIAGGTDILVMMKEGRHCPKRLVSTMKIDELDFIEIKDGVMRIGAATKLKKVAAACREIKSILALHEGVSSIGKLQILNMATIAGNICTASPAADSVPPLLTLGTTLTLKSGDGERQVALEDFILGPGKTAIGRDEIVYSVNIPLPAEGVGSSFRKMERVGADIAKINIAISIKRNGDVCESCKVAVGSCAPTALLIDEPGGILSGQLISDPESDLIRRAGVAVSEAIRPIDDIRSTAEYRRKVAKVLFMDVFQVAWDRAKGDAS